MRAKIIAEIGGNHCGSFKRAKDLIEKAAVAGADIVKFQKRENRLLLTPEEYEAPHPVPRNSYGDTYGAHREFLEFTLQQHYRLMQHCAQWGVDYSTSVWDRHSAWEIVQLDPNHIKIPSACNLDWEIYEELQAWEGKLHISLGMTTQEEILDILEVVVPQYWKWNPVFYTCTSGYPVKPEETYLGDLPVLKDMIWEGFEIGFSGHHFGIDLDLAACALGAQYIERHFTHDKGAKGTDHTASLVKEELKELRKGIDNVCSALQTKYEMPEVEKVQRAKLKRKI